LVKYGQHKHFFALILRRIYAIQQSPVGWRQVSAEQISSLSSLTVARFLPAGSFLFFFGIFSAFFSAEPFAAAKFKSHMHRVIVITQVTITNEI